MEYRITKTQIENDLLYETLKALYEGMKALGLPLYIVGGTARDFSRAILGTDKPARVTTDLDVAIAIRDWSAFDKICAELERRQFKKGRGKQNFIYCGLEGGVEFEVDAVPFGGVAENEVVGWPPDSDPQMSVKCFDDVMREADTVSVNDEFIVKMAPLSGQLLKDNGHLCYITSNKWMRAGYGEKLRTFLANRTNPQLLVDFGGVKVFESATVDTNILLFSKSTNAHNTRCAVTNKQNKDALKQLSVFVQQQGTICDFSGGDSWVILSPIEQSIKHKIEAVGTPLKDWDINIYRGVLTGYNDAFIIPTEKRDEILANCQSEDERKRTEELIRPILRGRDIKRYGYEWANLWLINTHNGVKGRIPRIDIKDYPAVKQHLDYYWDKIKDRADQGDTPYNLRNCAYLEDFKQPKIIYREIGIEMDAVLAPADWFINNKLYMITGTNLEILLAFLNCCAFNRIILKSANITGGKGVDYMEKIRVPSDIIVDSYEQYDDCLYQYCNLSESEINFLKAIDY